jgi:hypothetical protein
MMFSQVVVVKICVACVFLARNQLSVEVASMENLKKSHAARTGMCASNTQHISSKEDMLAQVADAKFHTPCEIPTSFPWIAKIGKVEIFKKSHATHT